jgi:hypothetical protein
MNYIKHNILNNYPIKDIKKLIKKYNLHTSIDLKQSKENLIKDLEKKTKLFIDDDNFINIEVKPIKKMNFNTYFKNVDKKKHDKFKKQIIKGVQLKNDDVLNSIDIDDIKNEIAKLIDNTITKLNEEFENEEINYDKLKLSELKKLAKENNIKGYSKLKKREIINLLKTNNDNSNIESIEDTYKIESIEDNILNNDETKKLILEEQYKIVLDYIEENININDPKVKNEQYKDLQNLNELMNIKSIQDYLNNLNKIKPKHLGILEIPYKYFGDIFKNWYDFLGVDYSKYPKNFKDWKKKVEQLKLYSLPLYIEYAEKNDDLPLRPRLLYMYDINKELQYVLEDIFE